MMTATNYSNKQILENPWLQPSVLKVLSAAELSTLGPGPDPLRQCIFLVWVVYTFEPTFKTWYISCKSPDPKLLMKIGHPAPAALGTSSSPACFLFSERPTWPVLLTL